MGLKDFWEIRGAGRGTHTHHPQKHQKKVRHKRQKILGNVERLGLKTRGGNFSDFLRRSQEMENTVSKCPRLPTPLFLLKPRILLRCKYAV